MSRPILIPASLNPELPAVGVVKNSLSRPAASLSCLPFFERQDRRMECGIWECTPGVWRRQVNQAEFCHIISGLCTFTPEGGEPFTMRAGDAVLFPANTIGVWNIQETVRKTYVLFDM